jgi:hypothetical protein
MERLGHLVFSTERLISLTASLVALLTWQHIALAIVPGSGIQVPGVGDDFEDENWGFRHNFPKSSEELDKQVRRPTGGSTNGKWGEGLLRGQPDVIRRVSTPALGITGSEGALYLVTRHSGIPGTRSRKSEQDDIILNSKSNWGSSYPVNWEPSATVRVCLPPKDEWENRRGSIFGFRAAVMGTRRVPKQGGGLFGGPSPSGPEESWPGIFVQYEGRSTSNEPGASYFIVRGSERGDYRGPEFEGEGWWTFGMSFTADGRVHYYARPGVEDLEPGDHIASHYPYNFRVDQFKTIFFDVFNRDDGRTWSTPVVIDDPAVFMGRPPASMAKAARAYSLQ